MSSVLEIPCTRHRRTSRSLLVTASALREYWCPIAIEYRVQVRRIDMDVIVLDCADVCSKIRDRHGPVSGTEAEGMILFYPPGM